ncbi:MAG: hypothetical protein AB1487_09870 [Thermodesulfobacteriota bacterium]
MRAQDRCPSRLRSDLSVEQLMAALQDKDPGVRGAAAKALREKGDTRRS